MTVVALMVAFPREAVDSILEQNFCEFEFIVIDDGSTDSSGATLDPLQRKDPRVLVCHQENTGSAGSSGSSSSVSLAN